MKRLRILLVVAALIAFVAVGTRTPKAGAQMSKSVGYPQFNLALLQQGTAYPTNIPTGVSVIHGTNSSTSFTTLGPGSIVLAQPTAGTGLKTTILEAWCINTSSTATVAAIWDSGTLAGTAGPNTTTLLGYVDCPPSSASGGQRIPILGALQTRAESAIGMSVFASVNSAQFDVTGFQSR
jgi:hypothetical protein